MSAGLLLVAAVVAQAAAGGSSGPSPATLVGNPVRGKAIFVTTCAACHTLEAAGALGVVGPNLDRLDLPEATIIRQIRVGGSSLMGAAARNYNSEMPGFGGVLTGRQIDDAAAFVYVSTHGGRHGRGRGAG